jgi:hypothetical protein
MNNLNKKSKGDKNFIPTITPRILITYKQYKKYKKWKGCIYLSSSDLTGQVLQLIKPIKSDFEGTLLKKPIFIYTSANKTKVENKISQKLITILKNNQ